MLRYIIRYILKHKGDTMAKIKKMTKEEIEAINKEALNKIETMKIRKGRRSESEDFLLEIKEVISKALDIIKQSLWDLKLAHYGIFKITHCYNKAVPMGFETHTHLLLKEIILHNKAVPMGFETPCP